MGHKVYRFASFNEPPYVSTVSSKLKYKLKYTHLHVYGYVIVINVINYINILILIICIINSLFYQLKKPWGKSQFGKL